MNEAKFYYWKHRMKGLLPPKRGFVPVVFEKDQFLQPSTTPVSMQNRPLVSNHDYYLDYGKDLAEPHNFKGKTKDISEI